MKASIFVLEEKKVHLKMLVTFDGIFIKDLKRLNVFNHLLVYILVSGKDSCGGDSGSPLVVKKRSGLATHSVQIGLVSWGLGECGTSGVPGVYTNVAYFMKWILDNIE